ncbi:hypothetical protein FSP39_021319 [Pinctada imbricata]|uniref:Nudix hydrolase domain-containing protein n=1 Tax=Pinctada imbricata TaxID=66713 RepID=A0AA88YF38_PINIB|nr:hypothetical protein FSP39_021319 [Pinctada imbricata]
MTTTGSDPSHSSRTYCTLVEKCNNFIKADSARQNCRRFIVDGRTVGFIRPVLLPYIEKDPDIFTVSTDGVELNRSLKTFDERSTAVAGVLEKWRHIQNPVMVSLKGWRGETYYVRPSLHEPPLMKMERSGTCLFGTVQCGCHINGYTVDKGGEIHMWISQRSSTKQTYPNMYDQLVAGGLTSGLGFRECAVKECGEEASIPPELLTNIKSCGTVSYIFEDERGVFPEIEFVFDLLLPEDFKPVCSDGEVQGFQLVPISKVKEMIKDENFKPNSAVVALDFLIRHGFLSPDEEPRYSYLVEMMHLPLHTMFSSKDSHQLV